MFEEKPTARADMTAGTVYAITGEADWIYYGQVAPEKSIGFFRRRDRRSVAVDVVLATQAMAVITVGYPSITRALRIGNWKKLGRFLVADELVAPRSSVQWSFGELMVTIWQGDAPAYETNVADPSIQDMEVMAVWDAIAHIPQRLTADFGVEAAERHVGGPIWRERRIKEELAARCKDQPWHNLPDGWVPTNTA
jgi:hypothetical protein